jgi:hypothetical protein
MKGRSYADIIGGAALMVFGAGATAYAVATLPVGTVSRMGPGLFPAALGVLLAAFGVGTLVSGMRHAGQKPELHLRALLTVLVAILAFALLVRPFGIVPAVIVLTLIACTADGRLSLARAAVLAAGLALAATLVFKVGLGLPVLVVAWPW